MFQVQNDTKLLLTAMLMLVKMFSPHRLGLTIKLRRYLCEKNNSAKQTAHTLRLEERGTSCENEICMTLYLPLFISNLE